MSCWSSNDSASTASNRSLLIYDALERFNAVYKDVHAYLSIFVCVCGIVLNGANVIVLTRPAMSANPINALLTSIALSDAFVMISYIPYSVWRSGDFDYCRGLHWQTYAWACFVLVNSCLTVICHAVSIWITVSMALIRAVTVRKKSFARVWTTRNSYFLSATIFAAALVIYIPGMVSYRVVRRPFDADYCLGGNNRSASSSMISMSSKLQQQPQPQPPRRYLYITAVSELGYANQCLLLKSAFWITGVVFKMIPCILLTLFIGVLLHILTEVKQRKNRLRSGSNIPSNGGGSTAYFPTTTGTGMAAAIPSSSAAHPGGRRSSQDRTTDRTTLMLIVLLAVFLAAELPQGLLLISTGLAGAEFRTRVFMNLGALTDLLSLLNSAVNFVIYCIMSQKFRDTFCQTILPGSIRLYYGNLRDTYYGSICLTTTMMNGGGGAAAAAAAANGNNTSSSRNPTAISATTHGRRTSRGRTRRGDGRSRYPFRLLFGGAGDRRTTSAGDDNTITGEISLPAYSSIQQQQQQKPVLTVPTVVEYTGTGAGGNTNCTTSSRRRRESSEASTRLLKTSIGNGHYNPRRSLKQ